MRHARYSRNILIIQLLLDIGCLVILFFYFLKIQYLQLNLSISIEQILKLHYKAFILFIFSWYFISFNVKLYNISRLEGLYSILQKNVYQILLFSIITFAASGLKTSDLFSSHISVNFLLALFILTFFSRVIMFFLLKIYRRHGGNFRSVIFVDENINTYSFIKLLNKRKDYGFLNCGHFKVSNPNLKNKHYEFDVEKIKKFIVQENIQIIFISLNGEISDDIREELVRMVQKLQIQVRYIPNSLSDSFTTLKLEYYDTFPILAFNEQPLDNFLNRVLKRTFDILFSACVILFIFSWLFPIIALIIYLDSGTPIFYNQKRIGKKGKPFYCFKFRTMKASKDNDVKATKKGDSRITNVGKILRKTSLDETPQFINVFIGNMSVVGPRPHMVLQDDFYNETMQKYGFRHYVKPGITGLAQVKGFRGEIRGKKDIQKRIIADVYYIRNWSFQLDFIIIIGTLFKTILGDKKAF